jgi:hypothetical protein
MKLTPVTNVVRLSSKKIDPPVSFTPLAVVDANNEKEREVLAGILPVAKVIARAAYEPTLRAPLRLTVEVCAFADTTADSLPLLR